MCKGGVGGGTKPGKDWEGKLLKKKHRSESYGVNRRRESRNDRAVRACGGEGKEPSVGFGGTKDHQRGMDTGNSSCQGDGKNS